MDDKAWDKSIEAGGGDFMQSSAWGSFQRSLGRHVVRVEAGGGCAQIIFRPLPLGRNEGYVPLGPVAVDEKVDGQDLLNGMAAVADSRTVFLECDLLVPIEHFVPTTDHTRQPRKVRLVPIEDTDADKLLSSFHPTLSQNIERAMRHSLSVRKEETWKNFYSLYVQTMDRHKLRPWHTEYVQRLWETLSPDGTAEIWSVWHNDELLASNLYILFAGRATHLFGGSSEEKRNMMAPHFLHWQMMSTFSERGIKEYDLGKVDRVQLAGLTQYKERFGGKTRTYPGNFRYPLRPLWYRSYSLVR